MTCGGNGGLALWKYDYPVARAVKGEDGHMRGVAGSLSLLSNVNVATQVCDIYLLMIYNV